MTRANILQLDGKNIKNVARESCGSFAGAGQAQLRVEQRPGALPPEVFQRGRPGTDQFLSRFPML